MESVSGGGTSLRQSQRRVDLSWHRVPVKALFDNLEEGATVSEFLEWFPGVTKQQIETMLEFAGQSLGVTEQS